MATRPNSLTIRKDLTQYAFGLMQDMKAALELANIISPVVPTGGTSGLYNKFDETNAFKVYADAVARRAIGGHASEIGLLGDTANYNCQPYGLRIKMDQVEKDNAGGAVALVEQSKVRTLTINCIVSYLAGLLTMIKKSVSAADGKGEWLNANVDPILQLDEQIQAVYLATGMIPNQVVFDFGAWLVMKNNKNVMKRMPGADLATVTPDRIQSLLANPNAKVTIAETAVTYGGGLGNATATRQGVLGGSVLIFFSQPLATPYDPSFCKTFAPSANLFTEVYSYREEPHFDWFQNDWSCDPKVISSALCTRIDVVGAKG